MGTAVVFLCTVYPIIMEYLVYGISCENGVSPVSYENVAMWFAAKRYKGSNWRLIDSQVYSTVPPGTV